jgi:hypothetical protein
MLNLIRTDERLTYEGAGFKVFFRRLPQTIRGEILRKHTSRGVPDIGAATLEMLRYCVVGWEGVADGGKEIPFAPELVERMPDEVLTDILERANRNVGTLEVELGN